MAKSKQETTVTKQSNGTIVVSSKVSKLDTFEEWSTGQVLLMISATTVGIIGQGVWLGMSLGEYWSFLTLAITPIETVFAVKGVNRFNRIEYFFKHNYFKKPSGIEMAKIAFGLKKKNVPLQTGLCASDSEPRNFASSGTHNHWTTYNEFEKKAKEYEYTVVFNKTDKGNVMEQHFVPKPITLWDQAFSEARQLHNF